MDIHDVRTRIASIRGDRERGASQLAVEAARLLGVMAEDPAIQDIIFSDFFLDTIRELAHARPSMASLLNAVGEILAAWHEAGGACEVERSRPAASEAARSWIAGEELLLSFVADHAAEVVTGTALTLGYSTVVLRALEECWVRGVLKRALVAESRPLCEGRRTASMLAARGVPTTLITDAEVGIFAAEADSAVVGADTILPDGALINKTGTLLLALAARHSQVPLYTLAETHKILPAPRRRMPFSLEEKDAAEVLPEPVPGIAVRNVYFDLTPARLLTGYITEKGLLARRDIAGLARQAPGAILGARY